MKTSSLVAAIALMSAFVFFGQANASTQIVNISAASGAGTSVVLAAGNYTVKFIGAAGGGLYDGYSPWSSNSGCDGSGMNCSNGFVENLSIDFGHGVGNFDRIDGFAHGQLTVLGNNFIYATGAQAIAQIQTGDIVRAALPGAANLANYSATTNPISFSLLAPQSVNFFIFDDPYSDNRGGISILLDDGIGVGGVPEPATWAMMIAGFGLTGVAIRRRRAMAAA